MSTLVKGGVTAASTPAREQGQWLAKAFKLSSVMTQNLTKILCMTVSDIVLVLNLYYQGLESWLSS